MICQKLQKYLIWDSLLDFYGIYLTYAGAPYAPQLRGLQEQVLFASPGREMAYIPNTILCPF